MKYIKLGAVAESYSDAATLVTLVKGQVIEVEAPSKTMVEALAHGHLAEATKKEFEDYLESQGKSDIEEEAQQQQEAASSDQDKQDGESDDEEEDEADEEEDEADEEEDEDEELTNSEMIDALKASPLVKDSEKKNLTKLDPKKLKNLYNKIFNKG